MSPIKNAFSHRSALARQWALQMASAVTLALASGMRADESVALDFGRDAIPILSANCFACHGADANKRGAELRLDVRENAIADSDGYQVIVPGNPEDSELLYMITAEDPEERMPPAEKSSGLSEDEVSILGLLGLDHKKLNYLHQGRQFRATDVHGENEFSKRLLSRAYEPN